MKESGLSKFVNGNTTHRHWISLPVEETRIILDNLKKSSPYGYRLWYEKILKADIEKYRKDIGIHPGHRYLKKGLAKYEEEVEKLRKEFPKPYELKA